MLGYTKGYQYPHDDPRGWVEQQSLPEGEWSVPYYEPTPHGAEAKIRIRGRGEH
ncbi:MAG: hypothetical protein KatS3mg016_1489 [Fimbriimonadales bacterium]|nr:MAG: hypothetical protein KatS3mg016_1489 [Fimbriimonadales bacterium]